MRTVVDGKHLEGRRDGDVAKKVVGEGHGVVHGVAHFAELCCREILHDSVEKGQKVLGHAESGG